MVDSWVYAFVVFSWFAEPVLMVGIFYYLRRMTKILENRDVLGSLGD